MLRRRLAFLLLVPMGVIGCTSLLGDFSVVEPVVDGAAGDTQEPAVDGASGGDTQTTGDAVLADSNHPDADRGDAQTVDSGDATVGSADQRDASVLDVDSSHPDAGAADAQTVDARDATVGAPGQGDANVGDGDAQFGDAGQDASTGCNGAQGPCVGFTPSGGIPVADFSGVGLAPFTLAFHDAGDGAPPGDTVFDVDTGEITSGAAVIRPATTGDPSIRDVQSAVAYRQTSSNMAVFTFGSLSVPSGTTLKLVGTRAVAIASSSTITIDGVVEARPMTPDGTEICGPSQGVAPGGFAGGIGEILGHQGAYSAPTPGGGPGGGGGGMAAPGGGGGHASGGGAGCNPGDVGDSSAACGSAGTTYDVAQLDQSDFHGGAGGGGGGVILPPYHQGAGGGNGGGAIRLVAVSSLEVSGRIDASGCGGLAGSIGLGCASGTPLQDCPPGSTITAGGGGGAGGAIVLEAPRIQLGPSAAIYAMGGAGGSPVSPGGSSEGNAGCEEGVPGDTHASAGAGSVANAAYDAGAQSGLFPGCGGGGAFGWIRINAGGGNVATAASATLNPPLGNAAVSIGALSP